MKLSLTFVMRTLISLTLCFIVSNSVFSEPPNLSLVRNDIIHYHDAGIYNRELAQQIALAQQYIVDQALANQKNKKHQKLAVVLDIDETSVSNYDKMVKRGFIGNHQVITKEIQKANSPAIKATLALYKTAQKYGVSVFFVTGRDESLREVTIKNLKRAGYNHWAGLYLRPSVYNHSSIIPFKAGARAKISKEGYTIIATIGDQYSDIRGGYAMRGFKLPNPFYYLS